ncbi:MAG: MBL fold metallo-hydrolase, partial [Gemmatimonadaceae bacterium]
MTAIVNVGYDSTNYYVLGQGSSRLLVDVGWPNTLPKFMASLKRKDIVLEHIRYLLATHYHPDHAGLAQEL